MTTTINKLEEIYTDLCSLHNPPSQYRSIYIAILICENIWKTWMLNLRGKDNFVNVFQVWLPRIKAESGYLMKLL